MEQIKLKKMQLDVLITHQESIKDILTKTGIAYLGGLKTARALIFGENKIKQKR